ncbi:MAG: hypothetical protein ACI9G1_004261 [Pirellulaceae bacterium]|jgi:hypothetical protein
MLRSLKNLKLEKDSRRASEAIMKLARERLAKSGHLHVCGKKIRIDHVNDTLVLDGILPSFYLKQLLQEALQGIEGIERIENRVDVKDEEGWQ